MRQQKQNNEKPKTNNSTRRGWPCSNFTTNP